MDERASNSSTTFFVRDNDLLGNNRLYKENAVNEYQNGKYLYNDIPTIENGVSRWEKYRESISAVPIPNTDKNERSMRNLDTTERTETSEWRRVMYVST